jgi:hypothetical protein
MPAKGRPRLSPEELELRITEYCRRYQAARTDTGLPVFPTGKRETRQHREWIALYKTHDRLGRRMRGQCERCSEPAAAGSIFCERHRAPNAGDGGPAPDERRRLLARQNHRCPVCGLALEGSDAVGFGHQEARAILHPSCARLATAALALGPEGLTRLRELLWPGPAPRTKKQR